MMRVTRPIVISAHPSFLMATVGGAVATVLATSLMYGGPVLGLPSVDVPRIIGHVFAASDSWAFSIGYALYFLGGVLVLPLLLVTAWHVLPGADVGFAAALIKSMWGVLLWIASALLVPVLAAIGGVRHLFGLESPVSAAAALFVTCVIYGLTTSLIAAMDQGISAFDTVGWTSVSHGATGPLEFGAHRSNNFAQPPAGGERPSESFSVRRGRL